MCVISVCVISVWTDVFSQISDCHGVLVQTKFDWFLREALKVPTAVHEGPSFGYAHTLARSCFPQQVRIIFFLHLVKSFGPLKISTKRWSKELEIYCCNFLSLSSTRRRGWRSTCSWTLCLNPRSVWSGCHWCTVWPTWSMVYTHIQTHRSL